MIDLTPLEVRKKKGDFRRAMRGYEPALVDDFLDIVADRLEQVVRENLSLVERVARADQQVGEYRDRERALTEALVTAQEMREEMRQQTAREIDLARRTAEQEATQLRASAQQETAQLRTTVRAEVDALRIAARDEAAKLRSNAHQEREREEEAVRRLRARQQQFMASYRGFLERELAELSVMDRTFEVATSTPVDVPPPAATAFIPLETVTVAPVVSAVADVDIEPDVIAPTPDVPAHAARNDAPAQNDIDTDAIADAYFTETLEEEPGPILGMSLADFADTEPFEPEPFEPEPVELLTETADDEDDGLGDVLGNDLDFLLDDEPDDDEIVEDDEDELTSALLRNAAAAGYRLPEDDELLLDDAVPDEEKKKPDDGWLPGLLEDET